MTLSKIFTTLAVSVLPLIVACSPPPVECNPGVMPTTCPTGFNCEKDTTKMSSLGGYCEETGQSVVPPTTSCGSDLDCKRTETCDLGARVCKTTGVVDECKSNTDCKDASKPICQVQTSGNKCVAGTGKTPDGGTCTTDSECDSGYCDPTAPRVCKNRPVTAGPGEEYQVEFTYSAASAGFWAQSSQPDIAGPLGVIYGTNFYQLPTAAAPVTQTVKKMANGKSAACICVSLTRNKCDDPRTSSGGCTASWIGNDLGNPSAVLIYKGGRTAVPPANVTYNVNRGHCIAVGAMGIVPSTEGDC